MNESLKSLHPDNEPLWLPTKWLESEMSGKIAWRGLFGFLKIPFDPSATPNVIVKGKIIPFVTPVSGHRTIRFIDELSRGIAPLDTAFWREIEMGAKITRWIENRGKCIIDSKATFLEYANRVQDMLSFSRENGIVPISQSRRLPSQRPDVDIGFALLDDGIYFHRKGHHRLGCARALNIERIPCRCYLSSASKLKRISQSLGAESFSWYDVLSSYIKTRESLAKTE
jgi:hypothetical protein